MRKSQIFKLCVRVVLLFFTLSLSVISVLATFSALNILGKTGNVSFGTGIEHNLDVESNPANWEINIPFYINNDGYFDLTDLSVYLSVTLYNATYITGEQIYSGTTHYPDILRGEDRYGWLNITSFTPPIGFVKTSGLDFNVDLLLNGKYSLGLLELSVVISNLTVYTEP
ncbi:MAG: hypothetical protein ACFFAS_03980 [Promethearchaeota archaeon]